MCSQQSSLQSVIEGFETASTVLQTVKVNSRFRGIEDIHGRAQHRHSHEKLALSVPKGWNAQPGRLLPSVGQSFHDA
jgi:hypothetical protein